MIPIFGVILSTVPMVILALTQHSVGGALLVIAWISVIHAIEAYLLNPNILGHSASMNPIIVVFALLAGKQFGGLTGALLAVPIASVIVSLFGYYRRLVAENYATETGGAVPDAMTTGRLLSPAAQRRALVSRLPLHELHEEHPGRAPLRAVDAARAARIELRERRAPVELAGHRRCRRASPFIWC